MYKVTLMPLTNFCTVVLYIIGLSALKYFVKTIIVLLSLRMSVNKTDESHSEDEIFFGKITLQEVKKRLFTDKLCSASAVNSPREYEDLNSSLKILEAHSEPNLLSHNDSNEQDCSDTVAVGWDMREDDSFVKLENMVARLCVSPCPPTTENKELNNTLDVVEYILNNPPTVDKKPEKQSDNQTNNIDPLVRTDSEVLSEVCLKKLQEISPQKHVMVEKNVLKDSPEPPKNTPVKSVKKYTKEIAGFMTPVNMKPKPVFKTPGQPLSLKKPASLKKTPTFRSNAYEHISSPVASYIKNCPIVPLVKDVHPKKPLPGPSSIPKLKSFIPIKPCNKENINLPSVAYKSAKNTKVIDLPDQQKLPQSPWAKKVMTSLPRPTVMKHDSREKNLAQTKQLPQQEDSFADLSYHQAEISICTKKTAFKSNKNL